MNRILIHSFLVSLMLTASLQGAREILLQLAPEADAPVIAKIVATDKVILDTPPARQNAAEGWRQLALPTPFEGYVPIQKLDKNMAIVPNTPVHYLPTAQSAQITQIEEGDRYEVVREQNDWATVRIDKDITGYFSDTAAAIVAIDLDAPAPQRSQTDPRAERSSGAFAPSDSEGLGSQTNNAVNLNQTPKPAPLTIPAPRRPINPDAPISRRDPGSLPPENVVWKPTAAARSEGESKTRRVNGSPLRSSSFGGQAASRGSITDPESIIGNTNPPDRSSIATPPYFPEGIVVNQQNTQAREATSPIGPAKTPRLLTGQLIRQIEVDGPGYPIRLKSPEGRLIAFVDLSGIYLPDLDPYLGQKVYLRGQIHPLPNTSGQLVILAETLRLSE